MIVQCSCGQKNRIPSDRLHNAAKCGKCGGAIGPRAQPIDVASVQDFDDIVHNAQVPVLVDFWAAWCGPCRMAAPEVAKVAQQMAGKALVLKVDTEHLPQLAQRYRVQGIPNFVVFDRGKLVKQQPGLVPSAVMASWLG